MVNYELIKSGHAVGKWVAPNRRYQALFVAGQDKARQNETGLWGACKEEVAVTLPPRQTASEPPSSECVIKGNVSEKGYGELYYTPACANYAKVKVDPERGEQWFCSEEDAVEAGWRRSDGCPDGVGE